MCQLNEEINKPRRKPNIIKSEKEELEGLFQKENNNLQALKAHQTKKEEREGFSNGKQQSNRLSWLNSYNQRKKFTQIYKQNLPQLKS